MNEVRVLVVGGGIAGLAVARALERRGLVAQVVERRERWGRAGTGLFLPANAVRCLGRLELQVDVVSIGWVVRRQYMLDWRGELLGEADLEKVWGPVGPCLGIHRGALHAALRSCLDKTAVRMGTAVADVREEGAEVVVTLSDGSVETYDLVIGADGVHSPLRQRVFGDEASYASECYWRAVTDRPEAIREWTGMWGDGCLLGLVPLSATRLYCFGALFGPEPPACDERRSRAAFARTFGGFAPPAASVVAALDDELLFDPAEKVLVDPPALGRIVLIGDAAHATSPSMAQGAALALEDGLVLADLLAEGGVEWALARYGDRRSPRVAHVHSTTAMRTEVSGLAAEVRNPLLRSFGAITELSFAPLLGEP